MLKRDFQCLSTACLCGTNVPLELDFNKILAGVQLRVMVMASRAHLITRYSGDGVQDEITIFVEIDALEKKNLFKTSSTRSKTPLISTHRVRKLKRPR